MPIINFRSREITCKIVYCGPSLGGKTTNIKSLYQSLPEDRRGDLQIVNTADDRTLFFDYFALNLTEIQGMTARFLVYGVPGQSYYRATRKMVLHGVDGVVFVADSDVRRVQDNVSSLHDLKSLLTEHDYDYATIPLVLQYNKRDLDEVSAVSALEEHLNDRAVASFEAVALRNEGVAETFKAICSSVAARLTESLQAASDR